MARMSDSTSPVRRGGEISDVMVSQRLGTHPGIYPGKQRENSIFRQIFVRGGAATSGILIAQ
jgi:hypothetical protein